jgi:hypothetical protein
MGSQTKYTISHIGTKPTPGYVLKTKPTPTQNLSTTAPFGPCSQMKPNPLLLDLLEDQTAIAIEKGNLSKPKPPPEIWASAGYLIETHLYSCRCGNETPLLASVYHIETSSKGSRRGHAFPLNRQGLQFPPNAPIETATSVIPTNYCLSCLPSPNQPHAK